MKTLNSLYSPLGIKSSKGIHQNRKAKVRLINKHTGLKTNLKRVKSIFKYQAYSNVWTIPAVFTTYILMFVAHTSYGASSFPSNLVVNSQSKGSVVWTGSRVSFSSPALRGLTPEQTTSFGGVYFNCISSFPCGGWATVDGYVGIPIADNILIVLDGDISVNIPGEGITPSRGYSWSVRYTFSPQSLPSMTKGGGTSNHNQASWNPTITSSIVTPPGTSGPHIYIQPIPPANKDPDVTSRYSFLNSANITPSLYIGKKAKPGTYSLPQTLYAGLMGIDGRYPYPSGAFDYLFAGGAVTINDFGACTISAPPTIDFGTVNLWNFAGNSTGSPGGVRKDVLGVVDGNLSISCTSDIPGTTTSATLTIKGTVQTYANDLRVTMDSTGNTAPATIRGAIKDIVSACSNGGVYFNSADGRNKVSIDQLGTGQTNIPYRFSLCSRPESGINQFGSASAQATITLDWD